MRGGLRGCETPFVGISEQIVRMLPRPKQRVLFEMDFFEGVLTGRRAIGIVWLFLGSTLLLGYF